MMRLHKHTIIATLGLLFFTACGGDSNNKQIISENLMIKACTTGEFTPLQKGDKVTVLANNTELDIRHNQDGSKKACALRGSAKVN